MPKQEQDNIVYPPNVQERLDNLDAERQVYLDTFQCEAGQKCLERLELMGYITRSTFNGNLANASDLALINEGKRAIVLHIKNMLEEKIYANLKRNIIKEK